MVALLLDPCVEILSHGEPVDSNVSLGSCSMLLYITVHNVASPYDKSSHDGIEYEVARVKAANYFSPPTALVTG